MCEAWLNLFMGKKTLQNQINFQEINAMFLIYFEKSSSFLDYFWLFGDQEKSPSP